MFLIIGSTTLDLLNRDIHAMPTLRGDEFTVDSLVFCEEPLQLLLGGNGGIGGIAAYVLARLGAEGALVQVRAQATPIAVPSLPVAAHSTIGAGNSLNDGSLYKVEGLWRS